MFGQIHHLFAQPGRRDDYLARIAEAGLPPGCLVLVAAEDTGHPDGVWVTEVWESEARYRDSLDLPEVADAIARVVPLLAGFEAPATTRPRVVLPQGAAFTLP